MRALGVPAKWHAPPRGPRMGARSGRREDLGGTFFRSSREANLARLFNHLGIPWEYEPREFVFPCRGTDSFTPDFRVEIPNGWAQRRAKWPRPFSELPKGSYWVELKGWMDPKSQTRISRFVTFFAEEARRLVILTSDSADKRSRKWGARVQVAIARGGVVVAPVGPLIQLGALLHLPGWEGGAR